MCFVTSIFAHILRLISKSLPFSLKSTFAFVIYRKKHLSTPKTGFKKIQPNRNMTKARRHQRFPGKQQRDDIKANTDQTRQIYSKETNTLQACDPRRSHARCMRFALEEIINLVPLGIPNTRKNIQFTVNLLTRNTTKKNLDKKTSTVETRDCISAHVITMQNLRVVNYQ